MQYAEETGCNLFSLDFPTLADYPRHSTPADERHRVVFSAIVGLPWDMKASSIITLGLGTGYTIHDQTLGTGPGETIHRYFEGRPEKHSFIIPNAWAYRSVDLRLEKAFAFAGQRVSVVAEAFNVFHFENYESTSCNGNIPPAGQPPNEAFGGPTKLIEPGRGCSSASPGSTEGAFRGGSEGSAADTSSKLPKLRRPYNMGVWVLCIITGTPSHRPGRSRNLVLIQAEWSSLTKPEANVSSSSPTPPLLDLARVEEAQRAAIWSRTARVYFPGLSVRGLRVNPKVGTMCGMQFGAGRLWRILSPPLHVHYEPGDATDLSQLFSVMLQLEGSTVAYQDGRSCELGRYEFCVIDQRHPFDLEVGGGISSHLMFLQIPRETVLSRHPYLAQRTAERFDPHDAGAVLMRSVLLSLLETASFLEDDQRAAALNAIAQLLGSPKAPGSGPLDEVSWRARSALAYIDSSLSDSTLTASRVAQMQGISRRRLDEILLKTAGVSVTGQIWLRRLQQAAADLLDPRYASLTVTKIAFSVGFEDTAHFTRAFKRRYDCTPREWRRRGGAVPPSTLSS